MHRQAGSRIRLSARIRLPVRTHISKDGTAIDRQGLSGLPIHGLYLLLPSPRRLLLRRMPIEAVRNPNRSTKDRYLSPGMKNRRIRLSETEKAIPILRSVPIVPVNHAPGEEIYVLKRHMKIFIERTRDLKRKSGWRLPASIPISLTDRKGKGFLCLLLSRI